MIIIYIHVCQKGDWKRSFKMIFDAILESKLYDECAEIRCGIVNDSRILINDPMFDDAKIKVFGPVHSRNYERFTLLHMRLSAQNDADDTKYLYCHTKGIRWFGTPREPNVVDWVKLLIYWNICQWNKAILSLEKHDVYGCNYRHGPNNIGSHYCGNFWWVQNKYLKNLPESIGPKYTDPEFWLFLNNPNYVDIYNSNLYGNHYFRPYPESLYKLGEISP